MVKYGGTPSDFFCHSIPLANYILSYNLFQLLLQLIISNNFPFIWKISISNQICVIHLFCRHIKVSFAVHNYPALLRIEETMLWSSVDHWLTFHSLCMRSVCNWRTTGNMTDSVNMISPIKMCMLEYFKLKPIKIHFNTLISGINWSHTNSPTGASFTWLVKWEVIPEW